jgi:type I restriction enzyme S subunit
MTWGEIAIGDLGRVVTGDTPPRRNPEYYGSAYPFIKPTDMTVGRRLTLSYEEGYSEDGFAKYRKKLIPSGSTAVVTIGSIGQKLTWLHTDCFVNQAVNAVVPDQDKFDCLYVYYLLKHNLNLVKQADTGASSGRENVSKSNFSALTVWACHDLNTQKRIAEVLDSLDSSIETNQRRIALLEDAARRIYHEWFVHLRFPSHESVPVTNGVPKGWEPLPLTSVADFINGFAFKPEHQQESGFPIVKIPELRDGVSPRTPHNSGAEVPPRNHIDTGDVLFSWSATLLVNEWAGGPALLNQHLFKVAPKDPSHKRLIRFAVEAAIPLLLGQSVGATMQHIRRSALDGYLISVPDQPVAEAFAALVDPMMDMVLDLQRQNRQLTCARDSLLPQLMSGQLDVSSIRLPEGVEA